MEVITVAEKSLKTREVKKKKAEKAVAVDATSTVKQNIKKPKKTYQYFFENDWEKSRSFFEKFEKVGITGKINNLGSAVFYRYWYYEKLQIIPVWQ